MEFTYLEEAAFHAWPALEQIRYKNWLLRTSNGYTKRANSANLLHAPASDFSAQISHIEAFYQQRGLAAIFRLTSFNQPYLFDCFLEGHGYSLCDESQVLLLPLAKAIPENSKFSSVGDDLILESKNQQAWLQDFCLLTGQDYQQQGRHQAILERIQDHCLWATLASKGVTLACGLSVLNKEGNLGLFDIFTSPHTRRQGIGTRLLQEILLWGKAQGGRRAYLQVESQNTAALNLYQKIGFTLAYKYWYRIKPIN